MSGRVRIEYRRARDHIEIFDQLLVHRSDRCVITLLESLTVDAAMRIAGEVALEAGSPILWFTFPGEWFDVGRFHRRDGTFTGFYTNLLTPVEFVTPAHWRTTDLFLDVWLPADGAVHLLDEEELLQAEAAGEISADLAGIVRREAARIMERCGRGAWPPPVVHEWNLEKAIHRLSPEVSGRDRRRGRG